MLVLDALIVNTDRHKGNYGILFQTDTLQPIKWHLYSITIKDLLPYAMEDDFRDLDSYLSEKIPRIGTDFSRNCSHGNDSRYKIRSKKFTGLLNFLIHQTVYQNGE